jgi:hypothetical protein
VKGGDILKRFLDVVVMRRSRFIYVHTCSSKQTFELTVSCPDLDLDAEGNYLNRAGCRALNLDLIMVKLQTHLEW